MTLLGTAKDEKKVEARINIEHLSNISSAVGIPLVLHGGSGIKQESVLDAGKNGITKINVGTILRQVYESGLKKNDSVEEAQEAVKAEVTDIVCNYYRIAGSAAELTGTGA